MGPLNGFKIVEIAGIGPTQFCGMLLADMGARIIRVDRPSVGDLGITMPVKYNLMNRSRPTIAVDLKEKEGVDLVLRLCENADAIFEGFRPGVMERLGLGPESCQAKNERLVYGRMTGWGQDGPLSDMVGHDGNYSALAGVLSTIGKKGDSPAIPLNLIADFGGGGTYLALGLLAAMLEASHSGKGQVVDAAMVDGAASLMTMTYGLHASGAWKEERESNLLDGGAPFYRTYETSDGEYVMVCAFEGRFFSTLIEILGIDSIKIEDQYDNQQWPAHEKAIASVIRKKSRDEWSDVFAGTDACVSPVLSLMEAPTHPHNESRQTFVNIDGITQPAPAPRFSRTESGIQCSPREMSDRDRD